MPSECRSLIQGTRLRVTRVDECGEVVPGACGYVVTKCFASVAMTDNVESPDEFKEKSAGGEYCVNQRSRPLLNWIETKIVLQAVDPELVELLTGSPIVYNDAAVPVAVGFGTDSDTYATASFALELWTNLARPVDGAACSAEGTRYGYLLLPWLLEGTLGDVTIENATANLTIDAITSGGNQWATGPYDVITTSLGAASPLLDAIPTTRHRHMQFTSLAPPEPLCGCQFLDPIS